MFLTFAIIVLVLWVLGFVVFHVAAGAIHLLLFAAAIAVIWHFVRRKRHHAA
jgi:uncharacterized membrane protein YqjE